MNIQNPALARFFDSISIESEIERENSKTLYGKYPYSQGTGYFLERPTKSINDFTDNEKACLKTIVAHMCELGNEIGDTSKSIYTCKEAIKHFKSSKEIVSEPLRNEFCKLPDRLLAQDEPKKRQLLETMRILIPLLIKDSYCMDQNTRSLIIDFLIKAEVLGYLDSSVALSKPNFGFDSIYNAVDPAVSSGLLSTAILTRKNGNDLFVYLFALNSNELKPKDLPPELEADWPFPV